MPVCALVALARVQELQRAAAEQAVGRVTEQLGERGVHRRECVVEIEHCEPERGPLEALSVPLLGLDPLVFRLAPVGDVADVRHPSADRRDVVEVGEHLLDPAVRAVGFPEAPLDGRTCHGVPPFRTPGRGGVRRRRDGSARDSAGRRARQGRSRIVLAAGLA